MRKVWELITMIAIVAAILVGSIVVDITGDD
jgi:hypothetical protein